MWGNNEPRQLFRLDMNAFHENDDDLYYDSYFYCHHQGANVWANVVTAVYVYTTALFRQKYSFRAAHSPAPARIQVMLCSYDQDVLMFQIMKWDTTQYNTALIEKQRQHNTHSLRYKTTLMETQHHTHWNTTHTISISIRFRFHCNQFRKSIIYPAQILSQPLHPSLAAGLRSSITAHPHDRPKGAQSRERRLSAFHPTLYWYIRRTFNVRIARPNCQRRAPIGRPYHLDLGSR